MAYWLAPSLLLILITPCKGIEYPLFLPESSVVEAPMNFRGLSATKNLLQDLDSFPEDSISQRKLHKIVKKQMAVSDYRQTTKNKRSVLNMLQENKNGISHHADNYFKEDEQVSKVEINPEFMGESNAQFIGFRPELSEILIKKLKQFAVSELLLKRKEDKPEKFEFKEPDPTSDYEEAKAEEVGPKEEEETRDEEIGKKNIKGKPDLAIKKYCFKIPDENDIHCYYECEARPYGCMKLKHRQCPRGEIFSLKHMKCLNMSYWKRCHRKKRVTDFASSKQPYPNSDDPEPANEWLDATQSGTNQKIPAEFKPKRKPTLKIYHLRLKRKLNEILLRKKATGKSRVLSNLGSAHVERQRQLTDKSKGTSKRHMGLHRHHPRSFLIRINKKEGKNNDEGLTENDYHDSDDDNDENDEEEDDDTEEDDEEPDYDENPDDDDGKTTDKISRKETIKEFFKSAKAAITNRARFTESSSPATPTTNKGNPSLKSKKSEDLTQKPKQVLLDANIKVDSAFSSALKNMLKSKTKAKDDLVFVDSGLISDRGSQDQMDPELLRMYEHLLRNNPRIKRYFLANCAEKEN